MSFDLALLLAPLAAGLLVLATHVPLGIEVLRRGIIFIDLAIAQVAGIGVIAAMMLDWDSPLAVQAAAAGAAVAGACLLNWTERRWPQVQEALIGLLFVTAAAAASCWPHPVARLPDHGGRSWVSWPRLLRGGPLR